MSATIWQTHIGIRHNLFVFYNIDHRHTIIGFQYYRRQIDRDEPPKQALRILSFFNILVNMLKYGKRANDRGAIWWKLTPAIQLCDLCHTGFKFYM